MSWVTSSAMLAAGLGLVLGALLGALHFASLRWNLTLFLRGARPLAAVLQCARLLASAAGFALLAHFGAAPLLAGALGFLGLRHVMLRRALRRQGEVS